MNATTLHTALVDAGYEPRRRELLALAGALRPAPRTGARALLLEGPPGCGKSALAEATAAALGSTLVVAQLHAWTDSDELFVGVDVAAAVAGDAHAVRQDGVLARVARASETATTERPVVVLLDEIDKAPERAEALLLDWLQSGRVPVQPGRHLATRLDRVLVVITSNGYREIGDALLRRVRRVAMEPLPVERLDALAAARAGVPIGIVRLLSRACREAARADGAVLSLQELINAADELAVCESADDVREVVAGWGARGDAGRAVAGKSQRIAPLWGEIVAARRLAA